MHQYYREVNSKDDAYYICWCSSIEPYMLKLIDTVLLTPQHEDQAYNSCNGMLFILLGKSSGNCKNCAKAA